MPSILLSNHLRVWCYCVSQLELLKQHEAWMLKRSAFNTPNPKLSQPLNGRVCLACGKEMNGAWVIGFWGMYILGVINVKGL